jgi:hypothetical protein
MLLMPLTLLLAGAEDPKAHVAAILEQYRADTRAGPRCETPADKDEIQVCARREAEQWRVPLIQSDPGDPKHEGVPAERARYIRTRTACEDHGPFLIDCGMAGVSMTVAFGGPNPGKPRVDKPRPPAP